MNGRIRSGVTAGLTAGVVGGIPSTLHAVATRTSPLEATKAAGALALPKEHRPTILAAAGIPVHLAISTTWGVILSFALPRSHTILWGATAGAAIATAVFRMPWHRAAPVQNLPFGPQLADHITFGATAAHIIKNRRGKAKNRQG